MKPGRIERTGVTLLEILVVAGLLVVLGGTYLSYSRNQAAVFETDQAQSAYYLAVGSILERMQVDARMARLVRIASPSFFLDTGPAEATETIRYTVLPNGTIEREFQGRRQSYSLGKPPRNAGQFIFEIKEVAP